MNANFINNQTYAIIISTNNNKVDFAHQTYALSYTMKDIINARYSEFWSKNGGYKEDLILFPTRTIKVESTDETGAEVVDYLFKTVDEYKKYLNDYSLDSSKPVEKDEFYDFNHMYKRFYCFGTCVEDKLNNHKWHCTWNGFKVDGMSIRDKNVAARFGVVYTFEEFSDIITNAFNMLCKNNNSDNSDTTSLKDANTYLKSENQKLKTELSEVKSDLKKSERLLDGKIEEALEKSRLLIDVKANYEAKLKDEIKSKKIELKNSDNINRGLRETISKIKSEYGEHISKLGDENLNLKSELREFKNNTDEQIDSLKLNYSQQVNNVKTLSYIIAVLSFIVGIASMMLIDLVTK